MATFVRGDDLLKFGIKRFTYQLPKPKPKRKRKISQQFKQYKKLKNAKTQKERGKQYGNCFVFFK